MLTRHAPSSLRRCVALLLLLVVSGVLPIAVAAPAHSTAARAASADRSALCDGYSRDCAITTDAFALTGQTLLVDVWGNRNSQVDLQVYRVEFNRAGQLTALVPVGERIPVQVYQQPSQVRIPLLVDPNEVGGWAYVGLADERGLAVEERLGSFLGFGGTTLKLLGDGYADQKPIGVPLDLQTVGQVPGIGYWVEYRNDAGQWVPVPGQGFENPQHNQLSPHEVMHLTYTVPADLTPGRSYPFRTNSRLNYVNGNLIARPSFAEWNVIPSGAPVGQGRGENFDPGKGPGEPDPTAPPSSRPTALPSSQPSGKPSTEPSTEPTDEPAGKPTDKPAGKPTDRPTDQPTSTPSPSAPSTGKPTSAPTAPTAQPSTQPTATSSATASATPTATPSGTASTTASAAPTPQASATPTLPTGAVWGEEEVAEPRSAAVRPVGEGVSWLVALGGLLVLLAPLGYWLHLRQRQARAAGQETL